MKTSTIENERLAQALPLPKPPFLDAMAKRAVMHRLAGIAQGELVLRDGTSTQRYGQLTTRGALSVTLQVHDPRFYSEIAFGGSIGAGEAYMQGYWSVDDLTALMRILLQNREVLDGMETGLARFTAPLQKALHWASRNTRRGSRRNIQAHYDLGNDFFQRFLDPTMMYSSAIFERPDMTLEQASLAKLDRVCRTLNLKPGDHVMEIGTGWGGFAVHAARHYGCHVTTTTISPRQHEFARARFEAAGLADRITLLLTDYRDLTGQYDKLVSIEMIEAVGHPYYDAYFRQCSALLKPEGSMLLQAITIADHRYEAAKQSVDFIQRYIFRAVASPRSRPSPMRWRGCPICAWFICKTSAPITPSRSNVGGRTFSPTWSRSATRSHSFACGSFIFAIAKPGSSSASSAMRKCCWSSRWRDGLDSDNNVTICF